LIVKKTMLPTITEYRDALLFEGAMKKYHNLEMVFDEHNEPVFSSGNYSVVFKMRDKETGKYYAVKYFTRDQENRSESYKLISKHLNATQSPYLVHFEYLEDEILLNSQLAGAREFPALVMEWVESKTLGEKLSELCQEEEQDGLFKLTCAFDQLAVFLLDQPFAHGDLNTDNILVESNGQLRLIDYDGMFTPEMDGQLARENGSPGFRHPLRTSKFFCPYIDDFSILLLSLSIHILAINPSIGKGKKFDDSILFTEGDLLQLNMTEAWNLIEQFRPNKEISPKLVLFYIACGNIPETKLLGMKQILLETSILVHNENILNHPNLIQFLDKNGWGFKDESGKIIIPSKYSDSTCFYEEFAAVCSDWKWGFINRTGQEVIPLKYEQVESFSNGFAAVRLDLKWGVIDRVGKEIITIKYDQVGTFSDGFVAVKLNGKWGYADKTGEEIIQLRYDQVKSFWSGFAPVCLEFKWGFIDRKGNEITPLIYEDVNSFSEGLADVKIHGKSGFVDCFGNQAIPPIFDWCSPFNYGFAIVSLDQKQILIDRTGKEDLRQISVECFSKELLLLFKNDKIGFMDWNFNELIYPQYDDVEWEVNGKQKMIGVKLKDKWGFIDRTGNEIISPIYDLGYSFSDEFAAVFTYGEWQIIDRTGKKITSLRYDIVTPLEDFGLAIVRMDGWEGKCGFIDQNFNEIIPPKYEDIIYRNGLISVSLFDKWGLFDRFGNEIIPPKYDIICSFNCGLATVSLNKKWGYINRTGMELIQPTYSNAYSFCEGLGAVCLNGKWGFIDHSGIELISLIFDDVQPFSDGLAEVKLNGKWGFINQKGEIKIAIKYDEVCHFYNGTARVAMDGKWSTVDRIGNLVQ